MALSIITGPTILVDESISSSIDLTSKTLVQIIMPSGWTPAVLNFQVSMDNVTFYDLANSDGYLFKLAVVPNAAVLFPQVVSEAFNYMRFRSGFRDGPIPQEVQRDFSSIVKTGA